MPEGKTLSIRTKSAAESDGVANEAPMEGASAKTSAEKPRPERQSNERQSNDKQPDLQDALLGRVSESEVQVTMFLVNGVMLQGRIAAYDLFCTLLERDGYVQLAYQHAVSTIQPAEPVDLSDWEDDD